MPKATKTIASKFGCACTHQGSRETCGTIVHLVDCNACHWAVWSGWCMRVRHHLAHCSMPSRRVEPSRPSSLPHTHASIQNERVSVYISHKLQAPCPRSHQPPTTEGCS